MIGQISFFRLNVNKYAVIFFLYFRFCFWCLVEFSGKKHFIYISFEGINFLQNFAHTCSLRMHCKKRKLASNRYSFGLFLINADRQFSASCFDGNFSRYVTSPPPCSVHTMSVHAGELGQSTVEMRAASLACHSAYPACPRTNLYILRSRYKNVEESHIANKGSQKCPSGVICIQMK